MIKKVLLFIILTAIITLGTMSFFKFNGDYSQKSPNSIELKITQYSDDKVSENAKIKDPTFATLAFTPSPRIQKSSTAQLASVFNAFKFIFNRSTKNDKVEYGTWLWTPTLRLTSEYMQSVISKARTEEVNVIYLSIDSYLDIYLQADGPEKTEQEKLFKDKVSEFISLAKENDIEVDAEAGWRNWAEDGHTYKPLAIVNFVSEYNENSPNKFRGFQYDVEPYLLDEYKTDQAKVLKNLVTLVDDTAYFLKDKNTKFSVVIPDFWDKKDKKTVSFEYKGKKDFVLNHLLNILDDNERSQIILMSYRNFSEGKDGSIDISKNEMGSAKWGFHKTQMLIAQESGDVLPNYITFYSTSKDYYLYQKSLLEKAFADHPNFGGISVHYANAFFELR